VDGLVFMAGLIVGIVLAVTRGVISEAQRASLIALAAADGSPSREIRLSAQQRLKAVGAHIEVVTVPDAGHYPHQETPEVFLAVVKAFLAG